MPSLLTPIPLVYIDSCVYLDLISKNASEMHVETAEPRWKSAKKVFDAVNQDRVRLAASALIEAEVCCNGESRKESERVRKLVRGWFTAKSTVWTDVDRFLARDAADLSKTYGPNPNGKKFKSADATHMAAAIRLECEYLMTNDEGFPIGKEIGGVKIIRPAIVWQEDLLDLSLMMQ